MTGTEAARLVAMLMQAFPDAQFAPASSALYERELSDIDAATGLAAVQRIIRTRKWFPKVAEIRAEAAEVLHGPSRLGGDAWGDVVAAMRRVGSYGSPNFADPLVADAVRMLGWQGLCLSTNDVADRARFVELYDGLVERRRDGILSSQGLPELGSAPRARLHGLLDRVGRALPEPTRMTPDEARKALGE